MRPPHARPMAERHREEWRRAVLVTLVEVGAFALLAVFIWTLAAVLAPPVSAH